MRREGYDAVHCQDWDMAGSTDPSIWAKAKEEGRTVITKDEDFVRIQTGSTESVGVVWLRCGNCGNRRLIDIVLKSLPKAISLLATGERIVEIRS